MKLCVNCKYFEPHRVVREAHACKHPEVARISPVDGQQDRVLCIQGRSILNRVCGEKGNKFEPVEKPAH